MKILANRNIWAFTLIELMVVVTILAIVSMATYIPYAHHQKKMLVKQGVKEITQSLTEARNLAINGINTWSGNLNVWLYFGSWATEIIYYTLPYTQNFNIISSSDINPTAIANAEVHKVKELPQGVKISGVSISNTASLFSYDAITWSGRFLTEGIYTPPVDDIILIDVSYKGDTSPVLQKTIEYYTQSYISDY